MFIHGAILLQLGIAGLVLAETGINAWLRYAPIDVTTFSNKTLQSAIPNQIIALNAALGSPVDTAAKEIQRGLHNLFGKRVNISSSAVSKSQSSITVGTVSQYKLGHGNCSTLSSLIEDGYWLDIGRSTINIVGQNERGALYGAFQYLSMLAQGNFSQISYISNPSAPIRWINQWDNLQAGGTHGSVERGYGGPSIFWENGTVISDLTRVTQYARLLASIGINGAVVNNVNSNETFLTSRIIDGFAKIADAMRPYGVRLAMSPYFASPQALKELPTSDPLDPAVVAWWQDRTAQLYERIPDFAGYLVKANSEGQPGPLTYNRTLAQGANLFARALQPYDGVLMFRAFVYDSTSLNESVWNEDRANAAVEFFSGLDGQFEDNVVVQIKYGPIDFQVREPTSPLFSHLRNTNLALEVEISQEYLGQQCHLVYLPPLWHTVTDFDLRIDNQTSFMRDLVSGPRPGRALGGFAGVANVGTNQTWLGSHLAMSNLYAFGRLAWRPTDEPTSVLQDWIRLTFGLDKQVVDIITELSLESWPSYENYTGNLGVQTLTDILNAHYGPDPSTADNNPWGQWTRADATSIGMDRTVSNGTGFAGQYPPQVHAEYENIDATPEELLLWFHHVPYTHKLKSGSSIIQHFYDAHYAGAENVQSFPTRWKHLEGKIDEQRYSEVLSRLVYQAGHSLVWRDTINDFYFNKSGIADAHNRVSNHPYRIEAEDMQLDGYSRYEVYPRNLASGGAAIITSSNSTTGIATITLKNPTGRYDIAVNYFDLAVGRSTWKLYLNEKMVGTWRGDSDLTLGHSPVFYIGGHTATRVTFPSIEITQGDMLKLVGKADGMEPAPVDYVSVLPEGVVD